MRTTVLAVLGLIEFMLRLLAFIVLTVCTFGILVMEGRLTTEMLEPVLWEKIR